MAQEANPAHEDSANILLDGRLTENMSLELETMMMKLQMMFGSTFRTGHASMLG